jgi:hypothetical protein
VRSAVHADQPHVVDQVRQPRGGGREGKQPVVGAVDDERRNVDLRDVAAEVGQPRVDTRVARKRRRAGGDLEGRLPRAIADQGAAEDVDVVEVVQEVSK